MISRMIVWIGKDNAWLGNEGIDFEMEDQILECKKIDSIPESEIVVKNRTKHFNDCMGRKGSLVFVSDNMRQLIEEYIETSINFIPVTIEKHQYWFLNILEFKDCFDRENSKFSTFDDTDIPDEITDLSINESKIKTYDLFRIKEDPYHLFVTKEFQQKVEEKGISGVKFISSRNLTTE